MRPSRAISRLPEGIATTEDRQDGATPLALLKILGIAMPRPAAAFAAKRLFESLGRGHPQLLANLAALEEREVHVLPAELPYGFALRTGPRPQLRVIGRGEGQADAAVEASAAVLTDLIEGRIDSDTLFFRRDLQVTGNTAAIVGLRNALDRETIRLGAEIAAALGPLGPLARRLAHSIEPALGRWELRARTLQRALSPPLRTGDPALTAEVERCRAEVAALTARLGRIEARQQRREERAP
ncbi:MAG: SCP2 sterol-binding domain-containing protein [Gammaproteobacteria bacterium]|nr:SCP2 sterol-binding domain-containing protein [Gammaproteobacteria bacterium]